MEPNTGASKQAVIKDLNLVSLWSLDAPTDLSRSSDILPLKRESRKISHDFGFPGSLVTHMFLQGSFHRSFSKKETAVKQTRFTFNFSEVALIACINIACLFKNLAASITTNMFTLKD